MSKGFFSLGETVLRQADDSMRLPSCGKCPLRSGCASPCMAPSGEGKAGILVVGEAPGEEEDRQGTQFVGRCGAYLRSKLGAMGIVLNRDCRIVNAVNCRPPSNRTPTAAQISLCRPIVWREIASFNPNLILLLGNSAIRSVIGHRVKGDAGVSRYRGFAIPDRKTKCLIAPTYHPAFVLRGSSGDVAELLFLQDLEHALAERERYMHQRFDYLPDDDATYESRYVRILSTIESVRWMRHLLDIPRPVAVDFETTGLKPHAKGHRIVCAAFSDDACDAVAFAVNDTNSPVLAQVMSSMKVPKIAANMKFEISWSAQILGAAKGLWFWDTMLAAHVLDNRPEITSLKFQVYVRKGISDYDSTVHPYLVSADDSANGFNRIDEVDLEELLTYNGLDALFEYQLAVWQTEELEVPWPQS